MQHLKNHKKLIKYLSIPVLGISGGWLYYQIRTTKVILENALDTSVLSTMDVKIPERQSEFLNLDNSSLAKNNTVVRVVDSFRFSYARRLLSLAKTDNKFIRRKAIKELARMKLDSWHCSILANMVTAETAIGLARTTGVNLKLFTDPPIRYLTYSQEMLINAIKELLIGLNSKSKHVCMEYFISKLFVDDHEIGKIDSDLALTELNKFIQSRKDIIPMCLETLLHHASIHSYAKDIVELNGLPLLMEIHNRFKDNIEVTIKLCKLLAYLSAVPNLLEPIFKAGWIGLLAQWVQSKDIRISAPAAKALANFDKDHDPVYHRNVYLLHPMQRSRAHEADVIFVHGLLGGVFFTWRQRTITKPLEFLQEEHKKQANTIQTINLSDPVTKKYLERMKEFISDEKDKLGDIEVVLNDIPIGSNSNAKTSISLNELSKMHRADTESVCWPKDWLAEDVNGLRIIGINYQTSLSMWAPLCPAERIKTNLEDRTNELMNSLLMAGVGNKPIIWVTHSMGGLLVKNIMCKAYNSSDNNLKRICNNTKAIVFYSTPHFGSKLANLNQATTLLLWPSVEVQELRENNDGLLELHREFRKVVDAVRIKVVTFLEKQATKITTKFNFLLVESKSGNPGFGEYFEIPQDHIGICKPLYKDSFLYQKVLDLVKEVLEECYNLN